MDTNTVIEGTVKFRDGKKWKSRWCVVRKLSPVADCLHLQLYRDSKERYKQGQTKASLSLENFLGIQSGFTLDKESNTLAVICQEVIVVLAFDTREHLMQWQVKISANLGEGDQFLVQISTAPPRAKLSPGPARLLIQEFQFCLTVGVPPRLIAFWQIRQLRRFGVVEGKFCFEGGSRCGRGEGLYVLVSEKPEELKRAFDLAADGKLFTRKRPLTRNSSVMDKSRKHHTFRPDSRLSDVSSLDSTTIESPEGYDTAKTSCCSCSHSREDLLSCSPSHQHPLPDLGNYMASSESHRFDLKSLWNPGNCDKALGRCTSCISKIGGMSRSSTLSNTPCSRFPVWTMDRPKSCGSQKMTCSSVSLSSHSSQGSCCPSSDFHHRYSAISNCSSACSTNGNLSASTPVECNHSPPSRPPKPAHLSFHRKQQTPTTEPANTSLSPMVSSPICCCNKRPVPYPSPYGNYDVPKAANKTQRLMKLDLKESPINTRLQPQITPDEFYDTPRKLKNNLNWEYGNYDVPPPAQPILNTSNQEILKTIETRGTPDGTESSISFEENIPEYAKEGCSVENPIIHVHKVKLTGEGKMPVMSPCGKIIEMPELSYEEKLDNLLENINIDTENETLINYANISSNSNQPDDLLNVNNNCEKPDQNYANLMLVQSLQNYENLHCVFHDQCKTLSDCSNLSQNTLSKKSSKEQNFDEVDSNTKSKINVSCSAACCPNSGTLCLRNNHYLKPTLEQSHVLENFESEQTTRNIASSANNDSETRQSETFSSRVPTSTFLDNKCNSTSCLHDIALDPLCIQETSDKNEGTSEIVSFSSCSVTATSSPALKRQERQSSMERILASKLQKLSLIKRSNSADSARLHIDDQSVNDTDSHGRSHVSSSDSLCAVDKIDGGSVIIEKKESNVNLPPLKVAPLVISESTSFQETLEVSPKRTKYFDLIGARRSASVPNKFFCNRDSSSSNDSGVSTGSLSFRNYGQEFLEFEMPLTTSMSSKRHHIAMVNSTQVNNEEKLKILPKRSKSVDPLRDLTFTFGYRENNGKSTSAEAEVPVFLQDSKSKDYLSPPKPGCVTDSRSTSSDTSDMSDYFETLSFSSFSSLDVPESFRYGRPSASTMKPRSGKEYHKIDRFLLDQDAKQ